MQSSDRGVWQATYNMRAGVQEKGLYRGKVDNKMSLPQCSRSKDIIEPMLKPQWWVNCQDMAAGACTAARDGSLQILPQEFEAVWFRCAVHRTSFARSVCMPCMHARMFVLRTLG
jgi:valyl-tRNA synthetase